MYCQNCGGKAEGGKFCTYCGAPLQEQKKTSFYTPQEEQKVTGFCLRCGQKLRGEKVCPFCSAPVDAPYPSSPSNERAYREYRETDYTPRKQSSAANDFVFAIVAIICAFLPVIGSIPSLGFGIAAIARGAKNKNLFAVLLGSVAVIVAIVFLVLFFIGVTSSTDVYPPYDYYY